jgi:hypothetical protein
MWDCASESRRIKPSLIETLPLIVVKKDSLHDEMLWRSASQGQKVLLIALGKKSSIVNIQFRLVWVRPR